MEQEMQETQQGTRYYVLQPQLDYEEDHDEDEWEDRRPEIVGVVTKAQRQNDKDWAPLDDSVEAAADKEVNQGLRSVATIKVEERRFSDSCEFDDPERSNEGDNHTSSEIANSCTIEQYYHGVKSWLVKQQFTHGVGQSYCFKPENCIGHNIKFYRQC